MQTTLPSRPARAGEFALALSEAAWLAILIALPLVMNVSVARSFEATKLWAVMPIAVFCLAGLVAALAARVGVPLAPVQKNVPALAFAALMICAIVATAASETPWIAFFGDYFRREGLISWLLYGTLFFSMLYALRRREQLERVIDVLLLASVIPCVYAIMQRYGLDFFLTRGAEVGGINTRPGGTMGNPTYLASLLLLVIPVTIARALTAEGRPWIRAPWVLLVLLQMFAALFSQSRGPVIGIAAALFVLLLLLAARARARMPVMAACAVALAGAAALALINFVPALGRAVAGTPLQRLAFGSTGDHAIDARQGIWQAGVDSFTHAPLWRQLIGYGPDAASFNYFNWLPAAGQRDVGYSETIDRLHCEFLDVLLSFGALGVLAQIVLVSSLVWMAAQYLLPLPGTDHATAGNAASGKRPAWRPFAALVAAGGLAGALVAYALGGHRGLLPVGAGAGLAAAWTVFLAWRVWRHVQTSAHLLPADMPRADALLLAALVSGLIGSWAEMQVGVPTIATRAVFAVFAALLILCARAAWDAVAAQPLPEDATGEPETPEAGSKAKKKRLALEAAREARREAKLERRREAQVMQASGTTPRTWHPVLGWACALCLVIAVANFFPPLSGTRILPPSIINLGLIAWPPVLALLAALLMAANEARRSGTNLGRAAARFLIWIVPPVVLFCLVYAKLGSALDNAPDNELRERIATLTDFSYAAYAAMALLLAVALYHGDRGLRAASPARPGKAAGWAAPALLLAGAALAAAAYGWVRIDFGADVGAKLATWSQGQRRPEDAARYLDEARTVMPRERRHAGAYAARQVELASRYVGQAARSPAVADMVRERLLPAESALAQAHALAPRDPWLTFAYANVQQYLALRALDKTQTPEERQRHAELARKYMTLAHQQFPGHPWILRNWAQFEFDQGNKQAAYDKLKEMETVDPTYSGTYVEWSRLARLDRNPGVAVAAVRRGLAVMPKGSDDAALLMQELINLARESGNAGQALSAALEYTQAQPERIGAWFQLAELYELNGQRELALATAQDALKRFADRKDKAPAEYAALQNLIPRINYGAAGRPRSAAGADAAASTPGGADTTVPAPNGGAGAAPAAPGTAAAPAPPPGPGRK